MSEGDPAGPIHPTPTRRSAHRYQFYAKHHGRGAPDASQWRANLSRDEEFATFDDADYHDLSDDRGWLFGVRRGPDGHLSDLGTWDQQVSEYPRARDGEPWHGYPIWPLKQLGPENRRGEEHRPSKVVFAKMEAAGLLTRQERKRLSKGDHA